MCLLALFLCGRGVAGALELFGIGQSELHVVDVYEGDRNKEGKVKVAVSITDRPLILYFRAYAAVEWQVELEKGVRIEKVFLSGYEPQTVIGIPARVPILKLTQNAGYSASGVSRPTTYQYLYKGEHFYIGGKPEEHVAAEQARLRISEGPSTNHGVGNEGIQVGGSGPISSDTIDQYQHVAISALSDAPGAPGSGAIVAGLLTTVLANAGFTVVERAQLEKVLAEQRLQLTNGDDQTALRIGKLAGAKAVVLGEVSRVKQGPQWTPQNGSGYQSEVTLSLRLVDGETGIVLFTGLGHAGDRNNVSLENLTSRVLKALVTRLLLKAGLVATGQMGFGWTEQVKSGAHAYVVTEVVANSSAYEAGLRTGDYILGCNGSSSVTWHAQWQSMRACQGEAGQYIVLNVAQGNKRQAIRFQLAADNGSR
jgi:hypothetical protein